MISHRKAEASGKSGAGGCLFSLLLLLSQFLLFAAVNGWLYLKFAGNDVGFFTTIRKTYYFNTVLLPVSLMLAGGLGLAVSWRAKRKLTRSWGAMTCITLAVLLLATRYYATHYEPHRMLQRNAAFDSSKLKRPLRIVHLSDIQSAEVGAYESRVIDQICSLEPDLVLHTGDLIQNVSWTSPSVELPKMAELFKSLDPPLGKFHVPGDTDWCWVEQKSIAEETGGLRILESDEAVLDWEGGRIRIFGLTLDESRHHNGVRPIVEAWLAKTAPEDFTILMGHAPDFVLAVSGLPIDLCLAGHTHGGQFRVPFLGPPVIFSQVPREWARGFREVGSTRLNVSAGIGSEHAADLPSIRFNCPSEYTVIEVEITSNE